nr:unnamed protein product [Callosobruchus chinensis]
MDLILDFALQKWTDLENALKCPLCKTNATVTVVIKVCGHLFCEKCLNKNSDNICPTCKIHYNARECTKEKAGSEIFDTLREIDTLLNSCRKAKTTSNNLSVQKDPYSDHLIRLDRKKYKINFVENLCCKINSKGETPLHIACKKKKLEEVKRHLLQTNFDYNAQDFAGWTPLHEAVEAGHYEIVETLVKHGVLLDVPGGEYITPLHKAASMENDKIVKLLLEHGANLDAIDYFGKKPSECTNNPVLKDTFTSFQPYDTHFENILVNKKMVVFCYHIESKFSDKLKQKNITIIKEYDLKQVTHFFIRTTHKPSIKILEAMLEGCIILPQEWIDNYLNNDLFIDIFKFTYINHPILNLGIQRATLNKFLRLPRLFDGMSFYIEGHNKPVNIENMKIDKGLLKELINHGSGTVLRRAPTPRTCEDRVNYPFHANKNKDNFRCCHYIIFDENNPPKLKYQMPEIKHKSSKWLINCIFNFTILE